MRFHGERRRALAALALVQVFFGVHYLAAKLLLREIEPLAWAVLRAAAAAAVLHGIALACRSRYPREASVWGKLAALSVLGVIVNQLCFIEGLHRSTATDTSLLLTAAPAITLMFAVLLGRESWSSRKAWALLVCVTGVLLVLRPTPEMLSSRAFRGNLLNLVNATSFGLFLVLSKRTLQKVDPIAATAILVSFGAIGLSLFGLPSVLDLDWATVGATTWWIAAYIVVFPSALGYLLNYWALRRVDPSDVALFIYLQPLLAVLLGVLFLGDRPGVMTIAGGLLVLAGVRWSLKR